MVARHCRRGRMPYLPDAVDAPDRAVALFEQLVEVTGEPQTVALVLDRRGKPLTAMKRSGAVPCDDLLDLCTVCSGDGEPAADSDVDAGEVELLVIASWRPDTWAEPSDDDRRCWSAMLERTTGGVVHLVDWLLVDGAVITSMALTCGRC
jgi:hypothetical protein